MKTWHPRRTVAVCAYLGALMVQHPRPQRVAITPAAMTSAAHVAAPLPAPMPAWTLAGPARRRLARIMPVLRADARAYGLPWRVVAAVALVESRGHRRARSRLGARGLLQVTATAARQVGLPRRTWRQQAVAGVAYLIYLRRLLGVSRRCAASAPGGSPGCAWLTDEWLSAYYAGPGHRMHWGYVEAVRVRMQEVA